MAGSRIVVLGEDVDLESVPDLDGADLIVTFQLSDEMELIKRKLPALYFHRYAQSGKIWNETVAAARGWLETWPTTPILNGKDALQVFGIEDTSLWWFVYDAIWEAKNGVFDTFYQAKTFLALVKEFKPAKMTVRGTFDFNVRELINTISRLIGFELKIPDVIVREAPKTNLGRAGGKLGLLGKYILVKAARGLSRKDVVRRTAFLLEHGSMAVESSRNGIDIVSDHYLDGLEEYMTSNRSRIGFISLNTPEVTSSASANLVAEAKRIMSGVYLPWIFYYSLADLKRGAALVGQYSDRVLALEQDPAFKDSMMVDGIDIYPLLRHVFRGKLPGALALAHVELARARRFVERERPLAVFHVTGLSPTGRAISLVCRQHSIPSISPQRGIISPELPINTGFLVAPSYDKRLLCEYLVWGQYYKELVVSRGYPESLVKTVGFWRTVDQGGTMSGDYVLYIAGANTGKLSYILSFEEEICTIRIIRRSLPASHSLIVKLHPSLEYEAYRTALEEIAHEITLVGGPGSRTIEEFLPNAKIVVGKASTVLVQALIMKKPVVVVNFASDLNFLGFEGVPFAATPDDFARVVKAILDGHDTTDFDLRHYCDPVGKESVSRIVSEIEKENRAT